MNGPVVGANVPSIEYDRKNSVLTLFVWGEPMAELVRRLRWALRRVVRNWPLSVTIVVAMWLGVGVNLGLFTMYSSAVLAPEPYMNPGELVIGWQTVPSKDVRRLRLSGPVFSAWREETTAATGVEAYVTTRWTVDAGAFPEKVMGAIVTPAFFELLGVEPLFGTTFSDVNYRDGHSEVAIVSERFWKRRLSANSTAIGSSLLIEGVPHIIVGILPQKMKMTYPDPTDVWSAMRLDTSEMSNASIHHLTVIARIPESGRIDEAKAELDTISRRHQDTEHFGAPLGANIETLHDYLRGNIRKQLEPGILSVLVILLVACANVVMLLAASSASRSALVGTQLALGATLKSLIIDMVLEVSLMVLAGSALAIASVGGIIEHLGGTAFGQDISLNANVLMYTFGLSFFAMFVISLWLAFQVATQVSTERVSQAGRTDR